MLFPIDHGNSAMKTVNFVFPSGLIDNPIRPPVDTEMLEYDGKFWTLSGQRISYMRYKLRIYIEFLPHLNISFPYYFVGAVKQPLYSIVTHHM